MLGLMTIVLINSIRLFPSQKTIQNMNSLPQIQNLDYMDCVKNVLNTTKYPTKVILPTINYTLINSE